MESLQEDTEGTMAMFFFFGGVADKMSNYQGNLNILLISLQAFSNIGVDGVCLNHVDPSTICKSP